MTNLLAANYQTQANGTTAFSVAGLAGQSGVCRLTAWLDGGTGGGGTFEPNQDARAAYDFPLNPSDVGGLPVVDLTTTIDVGDDKNTASVKRALIRATRNGPTASALAVTVTLHSGIYYRPGTGGATDLAATYGTSGSGDYFINSGTGTWSTASPYATGTITIPAGSTTGEVSVVTRADNLTEQNLIVARLGMAPTYLTYAPGVSTNADILIFDGPEYSFYELSDYRPNTYGYQTPTTLAVTAVNAASTVQAAGWVTYTASQYPASTAGGYWTTASPGTVVDVWGTRLGGTSPLPYGLSDSGMLVGVNGAAAIWRFGSSQTTLPNLQSGGSSAAYGVNPAGTTTTHYIVGQSVSGGSRPVAWINGGATPVNLTANLGNEFGLGAAYAANDAGVVVGEAAGFVNAPGGVMVSRPFRTGTYAMSLSQQDYLEVPSGANVDHSGRANAVATTVANNVTMHHAAGRFRVDSNTPRNAVYWGPASSGLPVNPADLGTLIHDGFADSQSEATGINNGLRVVGWSGTSSTSADRRAVFFPVYYYGARWRDLNDRHFAFGQPSGWVLQAAVAIGGGGAIAGTGLNSSSQTRGFLLVPRTAGQ